MNESTVSNKIIYGPDVVCECGQTFEEHGEDLICFPGEYDQVFQPFNFWHGEIVGVQ